MVAIEKVLVTFKRRILIISVENTYFHRNYSLSAEDFFTDANHTLYWKRFFKKIAPQKSAILIVLFPVSPKQRSNPLSVESRNVLPLDEFRAFGLASIGVGATAKAQLVHLADHFVYAVGSLDLSLRQQGQMADLGTHKQHGTGILTSRHTGTATDAGRGIHGHVGFMLRNRNRVGIRYAARGSADIASRLDDLVEGGTVHHEITDDRERLGAPGFNPNVIAIMELAHVQLTGGDAVIVAMRAAVDIESAHAADALATVVVEAHGMGYAVVDELLIQDVKHLKERAVG